MQSRGGADEAKTGEPGALTDLGAFASEFLRSPAVVASPFPSSRKMVRRLLGGVPWDDIRVFVELGPGTGAFTRYALGRMRLDAKLLAVDSEDRFTAHLRKTIKDPRLIAITGSALDICEFARAHGAERMDCVLSGLPFSMLKEVDRQLLMERVLAMLGGSGIFLAYQVRRAIEPYLREAFGSVERRYHLLNVPPCHLYYATGPRRRC